jgi:DNA invertase Pin-like site-specific DNA recombinase
MIKTVGYIRVSTKEQNLDRQYNEMKALGIPDKHIYEDKASGKDMDRIGYKYMKKSIEEGDTIVIKSLDRLGRNQELIKQEWQYFKDNKINVRVLDMPSLNIDYASKKVEGLQQMISNIVFEVISWQAEEEKRKTKKLQREGIDAAKLKGKHLGRPKAVIPDNFAEVYSEWKAGNITAVSAMKVLGLTRSTFYKFVKESEKGNDRDPKENNKKRALGAP